MTMADEIKLLRKVAFLGPLDDATLGELIAGARRQKYVRGATLVSELEPGADVFVIMSGEATISVDARGGERKTLGKLVQGGAFGEMSSLTGELRSATVTANEDVDVLIIADRDFDALRERRPEVAVALLRILGKRLAEAETCIDALFANASLNQAAADAPAEVGFAKAKRGSLSRVWGELVVGKRRDCAFLTLAAFVITLMLVRGVVYAAFRFDFAPKDVLRVAYMGGFSLLIFSACASLLTFRPAYRRVIAFAYGVALALIVNELGVTLAFDIFYKDIHTADPNVAFDVERLYRRTESMRAIVIGLALLVQAAYLRRFYARAAFILRTRIRAMFSKRVASR
ncbi:MAG: cyclic nucleotide-binding domain-containing protein [Polyangiaceae bacterium]